jgi:hypothetical protein
MTVMPLFVCPLPYRSVKLALALVLANLRVTGCVVRAAVPAAQSTPARTTNHEPRIIYTRCNLWVDYYYYYY